MSDVPGRVALYSEVQSILGNGHMRPSPVDRHTTESISFPQLCWRVVRSLRFFSEKGYSN